MVLARAAAVIVSLAQTCIWWRPYHTTLGVIQTISREHGVLCSEQVCVDSHVYLCEPETITCLHARPFCVWLSRLYHRYRLLLQVDRVEVVQHTWLPESVPCSHLLLWLHDPLLNQLKQSNPRVRYRRGQRGPGTVLPCSARTSVAL